MLPRLLLRGRNFVSACLIRLDVRFWHLQDQRHPFKCQLLTHSGHSSAGAGQPGETEPWQLGRLRHVLHPAIEDTHPAAALGPMKRWSTCRKPDRIGSDP